MSSQCQNCKFCIYDDYGYSNYTVEGTFKVCAKKVHEPFDSFYGKAPEYKLIPIPCPEFIDGTPIEMDVDRDNLSFLTDEEKQIWENTL